MVRNFAVTGHTAGIGKEIYDRAHPLVRGFSRTNGYDITTVAGRAAIVSDSVECDIFINNAYSGAGQVDMLYDIFDAWKHTNRIIVNIGSNTTDGIKTHVHPYAAHKAALDKASEQLSNLNDPCKVMNIKFGWVGTERVLETYNPTKYITTEDAVDYIMSQIDWLNKYSISECSLRP